MDAAAGNSKWKDGEHVELGNHARNGSWELVLRSDVPRGRRIHKFVWVYKVKRDGEIKVRLCVMMRKISIWSVDVFYYTVNAKRPLPVSGKGSYSK